MANFNTAINFVLLNEGGYSNDPHDMGGETNYGLSKRFMVSVGLGNIDLKAITKDYALKIYWQYFWVPFKYDLISSTDVAKKIFDFAVNAGPNRAHKRAQRAVRAVNGVILKDDGVLGELSIKAINTCDPAQLICALRVEMAHYYLGLNNPRYIAGWLNRAYQ